MKIFKQILIPIFSFWLLSFSSVFAWWIDHFDVILEPEETNVWEAVDLIIKAVDKNNVVIEDYDWTIIIFSESDPEAVLPSWLEDNSYTFLSSDQWKIKFENAVIFNNSWNQDLYVYDLDDDTVLWIWEVSILKNEVIEDIEIEITSPQNWLLIWNDYITVSWTSQKNHKIQLIINEKETINTNTDSNWNFEQKISNLNNWDNTIIAKVMDSNDKVIWESTQIKIEVNSTQPTLKDIKLIPEVVEIEEEYKVELITNNSTTEASIIINENVIKLIKNPDEQWKFSKTIIAPSNNWNFVVWVILKDEIWHEVKELWVWNLLVNKSTKVEIEETTTNEIEENNIELNSSEETEIKEVKKDLTIKWIKVIELKSKSILSWDKIEWVDWYNIYKKVNENDYEFITKVTEPKFEIDFDSEEVKFDYFAIKAISKTSTWTLYEWNLSDATKVKTWPEVIILLLVSLLIWWLLFFTKSKKA